MHNQRLLYTQSKKQRPSSLNKQNNIKLFNESFFNDSLFMKKPSATLRYDYDNHMRMNGKSLRTITNEYSMGRKSDEKSPVVKSPIKEKATKDPLKPVTQQGPKVQVRKTSKSHQEIQQYTKRLLQNNTLYQEEIFQLKQQTARLRSQNEKTLAQSIRYRMGVQKKEEEMKQRFNKQVGVLLEELRQILKAKEEMQRQYKKYIEELIEEYSAQIQSKQQQLTRAEEFFKEKLHSLSLNLSMNKEQKEKLYFQASENKVKLIKQLDELHFQIDKQKGEKRELLKSNEQLVGIVKKLQKQLKDLKDKCEHSQLEVFKIQTEKNSIIIELKSQIKTLTEQLQRLTLHTQQLDRSLSQKDTEFNQYLNQLNETKQQLNLKTTLTLQIQAQMQQLKRTNKQLQNNIIVKEDSRCRQITQYQQLVHQLQLNTKSLSQQLTITKSSLQTTKRQLSSMNNKLKQITQKEQALNEHFSQIEQLNNKYKGDNIHLIQQLQLLSLQNKSLKQDQLLKDNQLQTLSQINQQLMKNIDKHKQQSIVKHKQLNTNKQNKQHYLNQYINKPDSSLSRDINTLNQQLQQSQILIAKYQTQISCLKRQNLSLNQQVNSLNRQINSLNRQIKFIVEEYEHKLEQKQNQWQKRVSKIQTDLQTLFLHNQSNEYSKNNVKKQWNQNTIEQRTNDDLLIKAQKSNRKQLRSPAIIKNTGYQQPFNRQDTYYETKRRQLQKGNPNSQQQSFRKRESIYYNEIQTNPQNLKNSHKLYY